eukprot:gene5739-10996_t
MDLPNRHQVRDGQTKLDSTQERALKIMIALSEHYQWQKNGTARQKVTQEMEQLVQEFEETHNRVQEYLDERRDSESSKTAGSYNPREDRKVSLGAPRFNQETYLPFQEAKFDSSQFHNNSERQELQHKSTNVGVGAKRSQFPMTPEEHSQQLQQSVRFGGDHRRSERYSHEESLGQDMWRQLQRVAIPVFSGDKRKYENWKAAFLACIDRAPATPEYKLLQLRQYLSGVALEAIENLGFSGAAYEAAKDRLERKFGGKRREIAIHLEDMDNFKPVRDGCSKDIEKFADLLDVLVVNLLESGRHDELGNGSLYIKLLKKLPETLLTQYNRWIFENRRRECVETLKMWVIQESEFYTVARETVHGVSSERRNSRSRNLAGEKKTTFFGATEELTQVNRFQVGRSGVTGGKYGKQRLCKVCNGRHGVWACDAFRNMDIRQRWNVAKHFKLCFRCLGDDHSGSKCTRSRVCGIRGCQETHNKLLHSMGNRITGKQNSNKTRTPEAFNQQSVSSSSQQQLSSSVTEGERLQRNFATQTTMVCSKSDVKGATALRTIPVVLKNGCRRLKLNALLDDASTQTYVNEDVAAELGLNGTFETIKVNVLNGDCKSFQTMPVEFGLESVSGDVDIRVKALTAKRVTGNMKVIQWSHLADKWPHLKHIDFPDTGLRPIVDLLIGIDYLDMHYSYEEVRGQEGEPIARRTPLGWTCVGCPEGKKIPDTHFSKTTLFTTSRSDVDEINSTMKKFWDIESAGTFTQTTVVSPDEKAALEKAENSFRFIDGRYEVGVPWKEDSYRMVNNHKMAMKRLQNTEKRLLKNPDVMKAYDEVIDQYLDKGYIRKVPVSEKQPDSKWYLPHFAILKPNKATTKIRIVFDASAKYEGTSLNDMIHSGPKLQRELFDVLLRFRCHPVAVVCDIAEMYLRIQIPEADRVYHRFLWRRCDQDRDPEEYEFSRVVFGITSSPFQAQFVIQKHAQLYRSEYPMASETALKSTYMDDSIDSVQDDEKGIQLYHQLAALWNKAGMHARKWLSNSPEVLSDAVQGFHWKNRQASIHPFVIYYRQNPDKTLRDGEECQDHDEEINAAQKECGPHRKREDKTSLSIREKAPLQYYKEAVKNNSWIPENCEDFLKQFKESSKLLLRKFVRLPTEHAKPMESHVSRNQIEQWYHKNVPPQVLETGREPLQLLDLQIDVSLLSYLITTNDIGNKYTHKEDENERLLNYVTIDFPSNTREHMHFVGLSRVTSLQNLDIFNSNKSKIAAMEKVKSEMRPLREEASVKIPFQLFDIEDQHVFEVVFQNARSLHLHIKGYSGFITNVCDEKDTTPGNPYFTIQLKVSATEQIAVRVMKKGNKDLMSWQAFWRQMLPKYTKNFLGSLKMKFWSLNKSISTITVKTTKLPEFLIIKASMNKCLYKVISQLSVKSGDVCSAACTCPAGIGLRGFGNCNHVGGVLFALEDFNRRGLREYSSAFLKLVGNCLPHLGASLDGEVTYQNETWRFEIKCPFSEFNMSLQEALKNKKFFLVEVGASPSIDEEQEEARSTKEPVKLKPNRKRQS